MEHRVDIEHTQAEAWKSLLHFAAIVNRSSVSPIQKNLIMVRASQINGCAFCLNMHTKDALKAGETQQRLFLVSAWKETALFTDEEKAVLALTEEITLIHQDAVSDTTYREAEKYFRPEQIGELIMLVVLINAWNRIAVSTHKPLGN